MENLSILRKIIYTCAAIFALQLVLFVIMLWPGNLYVWMGLAVMAILMLYLARVGLLLLRELEDRRGKTDADFRKKQL